ncbi:hypothetical protein ACNHE5_14525 [Pandoraea pnomenusa]|uniref:hypothetical protein n=1 Tax=Pandoraea pnomenusa TaxID=93220 RepID=UPI003CECFC11
MRTDTNTSQKSRAYQPLTELKLFENARPTPETSTTFGSCEQVPAAGKRIGSVLDAMRYTYNATRNILRRFIRLVTPHSTTRSVRKVCEYCARKDVPTKDIYAHLGPLKHSTFLAWPTFAIDCFREMPDASFATLGRVLMEHGTAWQIHEWADLRKERNFDSMPLSLTCLRTIVDAVEFAKLQAEDISWSSSSGGDVDANTLERIQRLSEVDIGSLRDGISTGETPESDVQHLVVDVHAGR